MHKLARIFKVLLTGLILCPVPVFAQSIESLEQFAEFSQNYYAEPHPELIPAALNFLDTAPLVSNPGRASLVMMSLSCIVHRPELKGRAWEAELAKLHEPARGLIQAAISTEPDSLLAQIPISPNRNDMNWACFFGSGEEKYLQNIVEVLAYLEERKDPNVFLTAASAQWSLSSNALSHPRVKIKLENLAKSKGPMQAIAEETLAKSPEQIRTETTAIVRDQHQRGVW